jgi:hypothetical protein
MAGLERQLDEDRSAVKWVKNNVSLGESLAGEDTGEIVGTATDLQCQRLCQAYIMAGSEGLSGSTALPVRRFDQWANASDGKHLLTQLVLTPYLTVDLKPMPETGSALDAACARRFGVTKEQLLTLAREGFIGFNLVAFDSDKEDVFRRHRNSELVAAVLDDDAIRCCIGSIRRAGFFDRIAHRPYADLVAEGKALIKAPGDAFFDASSEVDDQHEEVVRWANEKLRHEDGSGNTTAAAYHYAYLRACGSELVQEQLDALSEDLHPDDFCRAAYVLRGLKTAHATKYSASFGGQYRMSVGALASCTREIDLIAPGGYEQAAETLRANLLERIRGGQPSIRYCPVDVEKHQDAFAYRILRRMQNQRGGRPTGQWQGLLPRPLGSKEFKIFLELLAEGHELRHRYNALLNEVTRARIGSGDDPGLQTLDDVAEGVGDLLKQHEAVVHSLFGKDAVTQWVRSAVVQTTEDSWRPMSLLLTLAGATFDVELYHTEDLTGQLLFQGAQAMARLPVPVFIDRALFDFSHQTAVHAPHELANLEVFARGV